MAARKIPTKNTDHLNGLFLERLHDRRREDEFFVGSITRQENLRDFVTDGFHTCNILNRKGWVR